MSVPCSETLFACGCGHSIYSLKSGVVKRVLVNPGDQVSGGDLLAIVCDPGDVTNEK